jgi:hypothetical protein
MANREKRLAPRVPCSLPVRLGCREGELGGVILDVSRRGVLLSLPMASVGLDETCTLVAIARELGQRLPEVVRAEILHPDGTVLLERGVRVVRIGKLDGRSGSIELGCGVDHPLEDEDLGRLGVFAPGAGNGAAGASTRLEAPRVAVQAAQGVRPPGAAYGRHALSTCTASVRPTDRPFLQAFAAQPQSLDTNGIVLLVQDRSQLSLPEHAREVASLVIAFDAMYGSVVSIQVKRDRRLVWSGPARIKNASTILGFPNLLLLGFEFARPLRPLELTSLGID